MRKEQCLWQAVGQIFTKLNILIPYDLAIVLLGICPKGLRFIAPQKHTHVCFWQLYSELPILGEMQMSCRR